MPLLCMYCVDPHICVLIRYTCFTYEVFTFGFAFCASYTLVLVLTRSRPALVLVLTWSRPLKVLVLSRSRYTLVLVMTWSRFRWS